jgi:hypothetical protein
LLLLFWSPWIQELQSGEGPDARWQGIANQSMLSYAIEVTPDFDAKEVAIEVQYHLLVEEDLAELRMQSLVPSGRFNFFTPMALRGRTNAKENSWCFPCRLR